MPMEEALAQLPGWISLWLNWMFLAVFVVPVALFIWRSTRIPAAALLAANIGSALGVTWLYGQMGYVKLLGLPHVVFWTPVAFYLWSVQGRAEVPAIARWIIRVALATIVVSLVFDYIDVARYVLGERAPLVSAG